MATQDLYDILTRKQVVIEGVKLYYSNQFDTLLIKLDELLSKKFGSLRYEVLNEMSKAQIDKLIKEIDDESAVLWAAAIGLFLRELKVFVRDDLSMSSRLILAGAVLPTAKAAKDALDALQGREKSALGVTKDTDAKAIVEPDASALWAFLGTLIIPANGLYLIPFLRGMAQSARKMVTDTIRQGVANGASVKDTLTTLSSGRVLSQTRAPMQRGTTSVLKKIKRTITNVVDTVIQVVSQTVSNSVSSTVFSRYQWVSVIDAVTTDICRSRNLKVYRYGEGPLPPAHYNCRSHVVPVIAAVDTEGETFYNWMRRQNDEFNKVFVGTGENGKFKPKKPVTPAEYKASIKQIFGQ